MSHPELHLGLPNLSLVFLEHEAVGITFKHKYVATNDY